MGAIAEKIWRVPAYLPYLQPPLTDDAIVLAEEQIGYRLPPELIALLRKQNGGYIRFSLPEMIHNCISGIGPNFPSLTQRDLAEGQEFVSFPLRGLVPFDGDGHWHICLDYRQNAERPSITYIDIECDRQHAIADSFAAYLGMLSLDVDDGFVLDDIPDIETLKLKLSAVLSVTFYPPDSSAHGYPVHRATFPSEDEPEWLWISPNTVPRGFVRENDRRYAELKDLMPGNAVRFPEIPAQSYILTATGRARTGVIDACIRSEIAIRPLREYLSDV